MRKSVNFVLKCVLYINRKGDIILSELRILFLEEFMLTESYAEILISAVENIKLTQKDKIIDAAKIVKKTIKNDGLIYVFGCGHSHILAEETFYRAGGLACVAPVFYEPLMLHEGAAESSRLEKLDGLAQKVFDQCPITEGDMLICSSTSGVNSVPVEFARLVKEKGIAVVVITSSAYFDQKPKNPLGEHLYKQGEVWIDNMAPHGDACLDIEGLKVPMTPVSTVTGAFIINSILAEATELAAAEGIEVPVYLSGNIPGGAEYNKALIERYSSRIKPL